MPRKLAFENTCVQGRGLHILKRTLLFSATLITTALFAKDHAPSRLIVQTVRSARPEAIGRAFTSHGAKVTKKLPQIGVSVLNIDEAQSDRIAKSLLATGLFTFVEQDFVARASATPNDPSYSSQWHLPKIQAPSAWNMTTGSAGVPIALIDSGVDSTHPDLGPKIVAGWNYVGNNSDTSDQLGHGTETAGVLAAASNNGFGIAGVSWANTLMPLVVLNGANFAYYSDIASAINYAADHGVRVVNISLGGSTPSSVIQSAVDYAWGKGTVVFAAAGNSSNSTPNYPAACTNVVAVSATDTNDALAWFSSYGSNIDVAAPGTSIVTTVMGGGTSAVDGTSFSSPIAAGVAALMLAANPSLSATQLVSLLEQNSDDLGAPGWDPQFGWGRVNAYRAVTAAINARTTAPDTTPPSVSIASPLNGAIVSGAISVQGASTDNVGVTKVELYVDSALVVSGTSASFSFAWNSAAYPNGSHTLLVKAYDAAGNTGSATTTVSVNNLVLTTIDTQPPTVSITSPANGAWVRNIVQISVSASDNVAVAQVSIYIDGVQYYTGTAAPYVYNWNAKKFSGGTHTVAVKAWESAGNSASASPVTVTK